MKKNLIGAVAAGLALALAFTACESGNDNPIRIPTDADAAVYEKKTFDYKAAPTIYSEITTNSIKAYNEAIPTVTRNNTDLPNKVSNQEYQAGANTTSTDYTTNTYYDFSKYVDGINSYNRISGTWSGKNEKGKAIGDVLNTQFDTLSLNAVDKTFKYSKKTSKYEVRGLRTREFIKYDDGGTTHASRSYYMKKLTDTTSYDTLPYYVLAEVATWTPASTPVAYTVVDTFGWSPSYPSTGDYPYLVEGRVTSHAAARATIKLALDYAKDIQKKAEQALITAGTSGDGSGVTTYDTDVKNAKAAVAKLDNLLKQSDYFERGARVSVLDTETVDEKTTGSLKYYDKFGGTLIATEDKAATDESKKAMTGKYTINGNYLTSTEILITEFTEGKDKYVFTDDKDYYYKNDVRGVITADFPVATAFDAANSKPGSKYQTAARKLKLENGTITGTGVDVHYTNRAAKNTTVVGTTYGIIGFFLGSSYTSYENYYNTFRTPLSENTTTCETPVSYSYKM